MKPHTSKNTEAHSPPKKNASRLVGREDAKMLNICSDERSILTLYLRQSNSAATPPPHDLKRIDQFVRSGLHLADLRDFSPWHFDDTRNHAEEIVDLAKRLTFVHRFSRTASCEMRVVNSAPRPGHLMQDSCEWTGRPKPKHLAEYRRWVLLAAQLLADCWKGRLLYGLGVNPTYTEFWGFEPKGTPKLIQKVPLGIP